MSLAGDRFLAERLGTRGDPSRSGNYKSVIRDVSTTPAQPIIKPQAGLGRIETETYRAKVVSSAKTFIRAGRSRELVLTFLGLFRRPWACKWRWMLLLGVMASALLYGLSCILPFAFIEVLYVITMSMTIPMTMVCLFMEWDVTRRVTPVIALIVAIVCGGVAVSLAGAMNNFLGITVSNAGAAALTEEPIKGAMVVVLLLLYKRFPGILSGLALGCAVGAGFAVIETFEYAYEFGEGNNPSVSVLVLRGMLSPLMHMAWTAVLAGAMWKARGIGGAWHKVILSLPVWLALGGMMLLHAIWNTFGIFYVLIFALWGLLLHYVRIGVMQAVEHKLISKEVTL